MSVPNRILLIGLLALLVILLLQGCSLTPAQRVAEGTYDAIRIVDIGQTIDFRDKGLIEKDTGLASAWATGMQPHARSVYAFSVTEMAAHVLVSELLAEHAPRWTVWVWESISISLDAQAVAQNARLGARMRF